MFLTGTLLNVAAVKRIRVVNFLPALVLAPLFVWLAAVVRALLGQPG